MLGVNYVAVYILGDEDDRAGYIVIFNGTVGQGKRGILPPEKSTLRFKLKDN